MKDNNTRLVGIPSENGENKSYYVDLWKPEHTLENVSSGEEQTKNDIQEA